MDTVALLAVCAGIGLGLLLIAAFQELHMWLFDRMIQRELAEFRELRHRAERRSQDQGESE